MTYKSYAPTPLELRIDKLVRLVSPRIQANRVINREREHYFRYMAALPTSSRKNSNAQTSGETLRGSREKMQVMWNAINAVDNSGVCTSIVTKFQMYVCGTLRWQSRCGDRAIATQYEDYMKLALGKALDVTGRHSLRQMAMLDLRSILVKGDVGTNIVRDGKTIQLQGIEADRIGNPYDYSISNNYVRGLELDDAGRIAAARIFYRDRPSGTYKFEQTIPVKDERGLPRFLFLVNPISYDDYRGVSVFKTAIDNATYIDRIREYELQALMWAASQSGVFHTKSGALPEGLPFDRNPLVDASGNAIETYQVRPNTVTALGVGEDVAMFQHDRPSPNVLGILEQTVRDISVGTGLSYGLVWDMSGYTGPAVRAISSQDARTIETWQWLLREGKLDPVAMLVLGNAIANGELPFTPLWMKWEWFFPAKSTIDVGRESDASINEIHAGINTGARVAADDGFDIEEIKIQRGREIEAEIQVAMEVAKNVEGGGEQPVMWQEVYQLMYPRPGKGGGMMPGGGGGGFPPGSDGGPPVGRNGGNGTTARGDGGGKKEMRVPMVCINGVWYREDQSRDEGGRFADEGKGNGGGGVHPGKMTADPEEYAKAQLEGIEKGKPGVSKEKVNMQPAFVHRDADGNAIGIARYDASGVSDIAVAKEHRGRGVATGLLDAVKTEGVSKAKGPMSPAGEETARAAGMEIVPDEPSDEAAMLQRSEEHAAAQRITNIDRQIADYKPDRSLSDPTKTTPITRIPGVSFKPYTQTPFFRDVNVLQGNYDPKNPNNPLGHGVADFVEQRKLLFDTIPPTKISLHDVVATQQMVNTERVGQLVGDPSTGGDKPIQVVQKDGKLYILNGHHRVAAELKRDGSNAKIDAHVLDLDHPEPTPATSDADVRRYTDDLEQMPAYRTVVDRLKSLGADNGDREGYTIKQHILPGTEVRDEKGYVVNGTFTPERIKEHEDIITKNFNAEAAVKEGQQKVAVFLIGKPAAGKSTARTTYVDKAFPDHKFTTINTDDLRAGLSDYRGWNAAATQGEAKIINNELTARALEADHNLVFDEVAGNTTKIVGDPNSTDPKLEGKIGKLKRLGYEIHIVHVDAPMHQTSRLSWERFKSSGRFVDPEYLVKDADDKPIVTYNAFKTDPRIKSGKSVDNEGFAGTLTDEWTH